MKNRNHSSFNELSLDALSSPRLDAPVTLFKGTNAHPEQHLTLRELFAEITTLEVPKLNHSKSMLFAYEQYLILAAENKPQAKAAYNDLKNNLNGFLIGHFTHRANDKINCTEYVPCLVFDLDGCASTYQAFEFQQKLQDLDYVFSVFPSPSGHGLRVIVWTSSTYETHRIIYKQVLAELCAHLNLTTDRTKGVHFDVTCENESRHFYYVAVSPPDFYLNLESKIFEPNSEKKVISPSKKTASIEKQDTYTYIDEINDAVKIDFILKSIDMNKPRKLQCFDFGCRCSENNVPFEAAKRSAFEHFYDSEQKNPEKTIEIQLKEGYEQPTTRYTDEQFEVFLFKTYQVKVVNSTKKHSVQEIVKKETKKVIHQDTKYLFDLIETKLQQFYEFRRNVINLEIEFREKGNRTFEILTDSDMNDLVRFFSQQGLHITHRNLETSINSRFTPKYNPIEFYFESLPVWNQETDYIQELANYVTAKNQPWFELMLRKMLVRSIACGLGQTINKHCFVLFGGQHNGKTSFLRNLCPPYLAFYRKENFKTDKDGVIGLGQNFWIVLDELDKMKKDDLDGLKSIFSMDSVKERMPFGKLPVKLRRIANFVGTTNEKEILSDTTGNIRWLILEILSIQHDEGGSNGYSKLNMDLVWAQAYHLLKNGFNHALSPKDLIHSEKNNQSFKKVCVEKELLNQYFSVPKKENLKKVKFLTSTQLLAKLQKLSSLNNLKLGNLREALKDSGFKETPLRKVGNGFYVVEKDTRN